MSNPSKRVALPQDFINVGNKPRAERSTTVPTVLKFAAIAFGTIGVMTVLNLIYKLAL